MLYFSFYEIKKKIIEKKWNSSHSRKSKHIQNYICTFGAGGKGRGVAESGYFTDVDGQTKHANAHTEKSHTDGNASK